MRGEGAGAQVHGLAGDTSADEGFADEGFIDEGVESWLAHMPDGVFVFGLSGVEYINPALADILGYPRALLRRPGFQWDSLVHPDDRASTAALLRGRLLGIEPPDRIAFRSVSPDHTIRYMEVSASPLPGPQPRLCCIVRDITNRVSAEQAARRHNRLLQGVNRASRILVEPTVTEPQVLEALDILAEAAGTDCTCLEIYRHPPSEGPSDVMQRCVGATAAPSPLLSFPRWREMLMSGDVIQVDVADLPEPERVALEAWRVETVLAVPLMAGDEPRGFLRLDQLAGPRVWEKAEIATLQLFASTLGAALARREAETRLEVSEDRFRRLVENATDVVYRMALPSGVYEYVSPASTQVFGRTPEEMTERPLAIRQLMHPGWRTYFEDRWERLLEGDMPPSYEYAILHGKTGETRWLHQRNVLIRDAAGWPIAIEAMVSDVTSQHRTEEDLRARGAALSAILRAAPVGIGLIVDRYLLEVNDRFCVMTGYTREELLGSSVRLLYATDEDFDYVGRIMYQEIAATGSGTVETRWRRKDGVVIDILLSSTLLVPGDNSAGVTFIALDITERKAAEEQMTASLRQKEILLQEIHHRVKNNLALVSSLLGLQALHLQNPELDSPFNESRERVHAMARLHDHLYRTPDVDQVAMLPYVTELVADLREAYRSKVTMIVEAGKVQLHMDQATPCGLILNELLTNALKHAFPPAWHGTGDPVIRVTVSTEDDHVLLRVQDNGVGLPGNGYAREASMGCSLVEMLSRQLHGELEVLGQDGTCISVRFPQRHPVPGWGRV